MNNKTINTSNQNSNNNNNNKILVTGGVGYIGSHTCIELIAAGYDVVVYDNLSNSNLEALKRTEQIAGKSIPFIEGDVLDKQLLHQVFDEHDFFGVIHFAGLKAVGESVAEPLKYYKNNVTGTLELLEVMQAHNVKNFVFSSSATVYAEEETSPIDESAGRSCTSPYGQSKLMVEYILEDLVVSDPEWSTVSLRYFNPVGAHPSGMIGEDPRGVPNNLMPYISQVAVGKLDKLKIFGSDYKTIDGTGVRDYIHVVDLARGHVAALNLIKKHTNIGSLGFEAINLGTGKGTSVLQLVKAFEISTQQVVRFQLTERRPGDIDAYYGNAEKARQLLGWQAELTIVDMCKDSWHWQSLNPNGYR
ncbi:UDP-glucose 4-epimerase GalE [uncultured Psychrobacter sp.]|uniref:UDP-glucose 4-epimerase GalE n=1 Tax=uncultured Psychrobacter sp. TaxID=259303 RepID=UPI002594D3CE|nr:UDP-glucose 4-epimerase GalE [uncultured Psychrobacter sp.]